MANLVYGGKTPKTITYNGKAVKKIIYGGKTIWQGMSIDWTYPIFEATVPAGAKRLVKIITTKETLVENEPVKAGGKISVMYGELIDVEGMSFEVSLGYESQTGTLIFE